LLTRPHKRIQIAIIGGVWMGKWNVMPKSVSDTGVH
jgi:hypothetical protein